MQKLRNTADVTRQLSDVTQKTTYSLGAVLGGVTILSPKFVAANIFGNMHLQLLAMYGFDNHYQAELELNYTVNKNSNILHSVGIGCGLKNYWKAKKTTLFAHWTDDTENVISEYVKCNYTLLWNWFLFQTGFAIGNNNFSSGKIIIQLGYMYNF